LVLVALVALLFAALVHPYYTPTMMPYYGGWWFFFPFGFIFIFFIIFVVSRLIFWPWGWGYRRGYWYHHDEAADILRQRYARGEITKQQLDQMMRDLEQHA
jgi:putative membrane protein